ncbi:DELTA-alicitoxin-Pse2b-like [Montipora capricornis]|uniref:DELTA-alicitoxin-Pse2b-like n=1 Tax=Montipora capricornis TaxID=246305 RepID=UPI0035F1FD56
MIVQPLLLLYLTATLKWVIANNDSDTFELGKGINLRKINLFRDFQEREASVFEELPSSCFKRSKVHDLGSYFDYYESTKVFYTKTAVGAGLDASLQTAFTLGTTLNSVIQTKDSEKTNISGMSLNVRALTEKILVKKDCLDDVDVSTPTKRLLKEFERLPLTFEKPWLANSWKLYSNFLQTFGSHVITSIKRGSSIKQTTFVQSSESYSQRDFQVKSCVSLAGPTSVGKVGVEACANVSRSEASRASHMNTVDRLIVRGGTKETRNALFKQRTEELIEKLMNEAGESDAAVEHSFRSIWDILQSRFETGSDNYIRAVNLQYYYLGYLNYGCRLKEGGGVQLQKFDYTRGSTKESPEFECSLASKGCHNDADCHYRIGVKCSCYGKTCVRYDEGEQDTGVSKRTAYANTDKKWGWHSCGWKVTWFKCACYNDNIEVRKEVWRMPNRDAVQKGVRRYAAHHRSTKLSRDQVRKDLKAEIKS